MIRPWNVSDLHHVQDIAWKTWAHAYKDYVPEDDRRQFHQEYYNLENLESFFHNPDMTGFIALSGSKTVGFSKTHMNHIEDRFYITSLYVLPEFQGKAFGHALLISDIKHARKWGKSKAWLGVLSHNLPSIKWYERQGFLFVEEKSFIIGKTSLHHLIGYKNI
jgi:diamine N-acetyltransferase